MTTSVQVIDASALLAYLQEEPGGSFVGEHLDGALLSSVNLCEIIQKAKQFGADTGGLAADLMELGIQIESFSAAQALIAADLWQSTRVHGLSLADRACLALAIDHQVPVLTADPAWGDIELPLAVDVIR